MGKPLVFVSSVIYGMEDMRRIVRKLVEQDLGYDVVLSESEGSKSRTPIAQCKKWARDCDIYIGVLGGRYGWVIPKTGISITEMEFKEARKANPEKILIYVSVEPKEQKQEEFVKRVEDFAEGYFRRKPFEGTDELINGIREDLAEFIGERLDIIQVRRIKVRPTLTPSAADYIAVDRRTRFSRMQKDTTEVAKSLGFKPVDLFKKTLYIFNGEKEVGGHKTVLFSIWIVTENFTDSDMRGYTEAFQKHIIYTQQYREYRDRFTIFLVNGSATTRPLEKQVRFHGGTFFKVEPGIFYGVGLNTKIKRKGASFYENMLILPNVENKDAMIGKLADAIDWLEKKEKRIDFACNCEPRY